MMTELIILAILLEGDFTGYKITRKITEKFSAFCGANLGTVHSALKKPEKNGYISAIRKMSKGGQKSSLYSVTEKGKEYFKELMLAEIPEGSSFSDRLANIKIILLGSIDENLRKETIETIKRYHEIQLMNTKKMLRNLEKSEAKDSFKIKILKHHADKISAEIDFVDKLSV